MALGLLDSQRVRAHTLNFQLRADRVPEESQMGSLPCIEFVAPEPSIDGALSEAFCRTQTRLVLLVEDETFVRKAAAEVLESSGYRLLVAGSATEALEVCRELSEPVDLLLTDVVMPQTSGRELAAEFLTICPRAKVLLMSGYPERHVLGKLSTCMSGYLAKPFSSATLLQRVRGLIGYPAV